MSSNYYLLYCLYAVSRPKEIRPHLQSFLRLRLAIYLFVSLGVAGFVIYDSFRNSIPGIYAIVGIVIGLGIGYAASRIHKISWNDEASNVVAKMDVFGVFVLVLYILFEIFREKIVGHFVGDTDVTITSFSILAGVMYGRVLGIRGNIVRVLRAQDLIE
jgi:hypothetical protein